MKVKFDYNTFGSTDWEDLDGRMMLGWVEFMYLKKEDGSIRHAIGTRDLNAKGIGYDLLPMNVKQVPPHILTYIDKDKGGWRCFIKSNLLWYSEEVEMDDTE